MKEESKSSKKRDHKQESKLEAVIDINSVSESVLTKQEHDMPSLQKEPDEASKLVSKLKTVRFDNGTKEGQKPGKTRKTKSAFEEIENKKIQAPAKRPNK
jgi:hypothetical protein